MIQAVRIGLLLAIAALIEVGAAQASVPAWAWWTPAQAGKNVTRSNPQRIDAKGDPTTVLSAKCAGTGRATAGRYRAFACNVRFRDDKYDIETGTRLFVTTSTTKRGAVACWSRSSAALARGECRPPKVGG